MSSVIPFLKSAVVRKWLVFEMTRVRDVAIPTKRLPVYVFGFVCGHVERVDEWFVCVCSYEGMGVFVSVAFLGLHSQDNSKLCHLSAISPCS